jgi:uncharacterized repeat protein (TIGR03803 family)
MGDEKVRGWMLGLALFGVILSGAGPRAMGQAKTLHSFNTGGLNGPESALVFDAAGNLYGTTTYGGTGDGSVFELSPTPDGSWSEKILYTFSGPDGALPECALIFDAAGNLFGTTMYGGAHLGFGNVFELSPTADGHWTEKTLHSFIDNFFEGANPFSALVFDADGNLYGTTALGGSSDAGTIFELSPTPGGDWTETILHNFNRNTEGGFPIGALIFDAGGNLYGATYGLGGNDYGIVFELSPSTVGNWTLHDLHDFGSGTDGRYAEGSVIADAAGNLYGTTQFGGTHHDGVVFELSPDASGGWTERVLHNFGNGDGGIIYSGLIFDKSGNLYGTTSEGGGGECSFGNGCGTVFELSPDGNGHWERTLLLKFGSAKHGYSSTGSLIFDGAGNLYGTTDLGGAFGGGTVFEIQH